MSVSQNSSAAGAAPSGRPFATYVGVFTIAMATLMLEILLTRIASVIAWYHLAFFVISLGMLGMTAGAVLVFVAPERFAGPLVAKRTAQAAMGFAFSIPICVGMAMALPLMPVTDLMSFLGLLVTGAVLSLPFILGGVTLTLALTRAGLPANWVYGVDLVGAAVGCVAIIPVLDIFDAPSAAIVSAAVAALAAAAFARAADLPMRKPLLTTGGLFLFALVNAAAYPAPFRPAWVKGQPDPLQDYSALAWNTYSRVTIDHERLEPPMFWARGRHTPEEMLAPLPQRFIRIDGAAGTSMAKMADSPAEHRYLEWDISGFAHRLRPVGPAAVIGVGGGRDVLAALESGHSPVLGVELNGLILQLHRGPFREFSGIADVPGVRLVQDEARSYMARSRERFKVLTMSLIDTWASTGAGAYSLSENGLYTREAWNTFLDRLTDDGIFTVSRWYVVNSPGETARMLALAMETLFSRGVDRPLQHIILVQNDQVATLLLSPSPFGAADVDKAQEEAAKRGFNMLVTPRRLPAHPFLNTLARQGSRAALWSWTSNQGLDLTPPTDARPFFFNMLKPGTWLMDSNSVHRMDLPTLGNLQATQTLLYATLVSLLLTVITVIWPIRRKRESLSAFSRPQLLSASGYFALIGLGFMFVEMGMLSRLNVFLGHPTLALAVLLAGLIFFTGVGSMLSGAIQLDQPNLARFYPLLPTALVAAAGLAMEPTMAAFQAHTTDARVLVSVALVAPVALALGLGFPMGLRLVERMETHLGMTHDRDGHSPLGPWLWGINGACGVCASGLALGTSMVWGIPTTLMIGGACYLLLIPCTMLLHRAGS